MSTQTEIKPEERVVLSDTVLLSEIERAAYQEGWMTNPNISKVFEMAWNNEGRLEREAQDRIEKLSKTKIEMIETKALKSTNGAIRSQREVVGIYNALREEVLLFLDQFADFFEDGSPERNILEQMTPKFVAFEELKTI